MENFKTAASHLLCEYDENKYKNYSLVWNDIKYVAENPSNMYK